jgi:integration host factor subunit alpha
MTKADIIEVITMKLNMTKVEAGDVFESFLDIVKETLEKGEDIKIIGFGKFVIHQKKDRLGRNPQTGEPMTISSRKILTFKPSVLLKEELNK